MDLDFLPWLLLFFSPLIIPGLILFVAHILARMKFKRLMIDSKGKINAVELNNGSIQPVKSVIRIIRNPKLNSFTLEPWLYFKLIVIETENNTFYLTFMDSMFNEIKQYDNQAYKKFPFPRNPQKRKSTLKDKEPSISADFIFFKKKFSTKSTDELQHILNNQNDFSKEAILAAEKLLHDRKMLSDE